MKEVQIKDFSLSMLPILIVLRSRARRNDVKLNASVMNMCYGFICLVVSPALGILNSSFAFLSIGFLIIYYLTFAFVAMRQKKKIQAAIANICPFSKSSCLSITVDLQ